MSQAAGEREQVAQGLVGDLGAIGALHVGQDDVAFEQLGHLHQVLDACAGCWTHRSDLPARMTDCREKSVACVGIDNLADRLFFAFAFDELHRRCDVFQVRELFRLHRGNDHLELFCGASARPTGGGECGGRSRGGQEVSAVHGGGAPSGWRVLSDVTSTSHSNRLRRAGGSPPDRSTHHHDRPQVVATSVFTEAELGLAASPISSLRPAATIPRNAS